MRGMSADSHEADKAEEDDLGIWVVVHSSEAYYHDQAVSGAWEVREHTNAPVGLSYTSGWLPVSAEEPSYFSDS
jgi:hypothetical protein